MISLIIMEMIDKHKGHNVICRECNMQAVDFIDYAKALKEGHANLYNTNKCWCTLAMHFYCTDCKEEIDLDKE
jgi:Fe2+ or Zn2+ uptake regulation protein